MIKPRVVDQGDGPKIEGTRITVYTVLDYLRAGRTRDWIAALLHLSSDQVQAAMDYIRDHDTQVNAEYEAIGYTERYDPLTPGLCACTRGVSPSRPPHQHVHTSLATRPYVTKEIADV